MTLGVIGCGLLFATAPALAAAPEAPVMEAPASVTGTTATLKGELKPGLVAEKVSYHFAYSPGPGAACTESTLTAPVEQAPPAKPFPEAEDNKKVSEPVTKLEGDTEYTVCLIAANPAEPAESTQSLTSETFKTSAIKPAVVSQSSTVTPTTATLEAQVNPENQQTELCTFEYGTTVAYGHLTPCEPATLEGGSVQGVTAHLKLLSPGSSDHWRVVVKNASGEEKAPDQKFTTLTLAKPIVSGEKAAALTPVGATLEGTVNPNYQSTTYRFEYATEAEAGLIGTPGASVAGEDGFGEEFAEQPVSVPVGSLRASTKYVFRIVAENATGTEDGSIEKFETTAKERPIVVSQSSSAVSGAGAKLEAVVNPNYQETAYAFEYASEEALIGTPGATTVTGAGELGAEFAELPVSVSTGALQGDTTYYYRVLATNGSGTEYGTPIGEFTTLAALPIPGAGEAEEVTSTSATLFGALNPRGGETFYHFVYIDQAGYDAGLRESPSEPYALARSTPEVSVPAGSQPLATAPVDLSELTPSTTYDFGLVATNSAGTVIGPTETFTTAAGEPPPPPVLLPPAPGETQPAHPAALPFVPYASIAELEAKEAKEDKSIPNPTVTRELTKAEKLKKALKACAKKKGNKRTACEKSAHKKFGSKKGKKQ